MRVPLTVALLFATACGSSATLALPSTGYLVYVRDREGSVLAAVDDQGKTLSSTTDDGFGLRLSMTGTPVPREFLDKELDEETGYYRFRSRYYDPATAQWISPDPKLLADVDCSALVQGCQPYAFAGNRPLEWSDADGRDVIHFYDADGTPTMLVTAAFVGAGAEAAREVFLQGIVNIRSPVRIIAITALYATPAEVPKGMTQIITDENHERGDKALASETTSDMSRIYLGATALQDKHPELARSAEMIHELMHAAGNASEGYVTEGNQIYSLPGHIHGYGGNVGVDPEDLRVTEDEANDLMAPEKPNQVNSGADLNDPSFLSNPTLKTGVGGANIPLHP